MAKLGVHRILLLVISLTVCLEGTKLLAALKKCGDLECETLICRVIAIRDYTGPNCLFLNFTEGEEISVYVKLAGEREDLWAGSKEKDFGFFPRDAVQIEEVFISEEVEISTKESDFLCLLGVSYIFASEDSELYHDNGKNIYPDEENNDQSYSLYESDFQIESEFYATSESPLFEGQFPVSEAPNDIRSASESKEWEEAEAESVEQDQIPEADYVSPPSTVPKVQGWFGFGNEEAAEKAFESAIEPEQESSFRSRKIAVEDENYPEELNNGEPQTEYKQGPESESDSVPEEQSELASESEPILEPQATGWFGSGFTSYLGLGEEDTKLELLPKESSLPLQDVPNSISSDEEATVPCTEILAEKEDTITNESSILNPSWFDFGFGMLGFAYANEDKIISDDRKTEENVEVDKHEHPSAGEVDPDNEKEIKLKEIMETENLLDKERVLEKTDDSNTIPYLAKLLYNFDNHWSIQDIPKEAELSFPEQILDQNNRVENYEREEVESYPTDNMKELTMLENSYSQSDIASEIKLPTQISEDVHFETSAYKNNDDDSKLSVDSEGLAQAEDTLLTSHMASTDNSLSSEKFLPQKAEEATNFQILQYLFQIDVCDLMNSAFSPVMIILEWGFKSIIFGLNLLNRSRILTIRGHLLSTHYTDLNSGKVEKFSS